MKKGVSVYPLSIFIINHQSSIINLHQSLSQSSSFFNHQSLCLCTFSKPPKFPSWWFSEENFPSFSHEILGVFQTNSLPPRPRTLGHWSAAPHGHRRCGLDGDPMEGSKIPSNKWGKYGKMVPKCFEILFFFFEILDDLVRNPMDKRWWEWDLGFGTNFGQVMFSMLSSSGKSNMIHVQCSDCSIRITAEQSPNLKDSRGLVKPQIGNQVMWRTGDFLLVGGWVSTPLKNDGVISQLGWNDIPNIWNVIKFHGSEPPTSH